MVMYATLVVFQRDLDSIALLVGQVERTRFASSASSPPPHTRSCADSC